MSTNIEWAKNPDGSKGETWPVVTGCSHSGSPGCDSCYAARMAATRLKHHPRYEGLATFSNGKASWTGEVRLNRDVLGQPLRWRRPRRVFVASMGDWLHPRVHDSFIYRVLDITQRTPQHVYQFLTKRADRLPVIVKDWMLDRGLREPPRNIWQGVSIENQAAADERRGYLRQCPAAVKFVSYEPALAPVDWTGWEFVSQIISGGESGPGARPSHPDWHRATRDFCQANDIAYFMKQWGAWMPYNENEHVGQLATWQDRPDWGRVQQDRVRFMHASGPCDPFYKNATTMIRVGKKRAGHLLDGRAWQEFPVAAGAGTVAVDTKRRDR